LADNAFCVDKSDAIATLAAVFTVGAFKAFDALVTFEAYLLNKIFIYCGTTNIKSRQVAERCGFKFQYEIKEAENLYGVLIDHYLFALANPSET
jgi:RimJ/RimL family protein N-acetyltransferase